MQYFAGESSFRILEALKGSFSVCYLGQSYQDCVATSLQLRFLSPEIKIILFPEWDVSPYSRLSPSKHISGYRIASLIELFNTTSTKKTVVLTTIDAVIQKTPPLAELIEYVVTLKVGQPYNRDNIIKLLIEAGYNKTSVAEGIGEFAVRGSIIDLVLYDDVCYRLDFFGSVLETIKVVDTKTQLSQAMIETLTIMPVSEVVLNAERVCHFKNMYLRTFGITEDHLYHEVVRGSRYVGIEHWLALFYQQTENILMYLPREALVIKHQSFLQTLHEYYLLLETNYQQRSEALKQKDRSYYPMLPAASYMLQSEFSEALAIFKNYDAAYNAELPLNCFALKKHDKANTLRKLSDYALDHKICVVIQSEDSLYKMSQLLKTLEIPNLHIQSALEIQDKGLLYLACFEFSGAASYNQISFYSASFLFGDKGSVKNRRKKSGDVKFFQELMTIQPGDLLVHIQYGIGKFAGLCTLQVQNVPHDFMEIIYSGNDKLYVPVENLEVVSRYGEDSQGVELDKLGGIAWQSRKEALKEKIKIAAETLLKIAAARETAQGSILKPINEFYQRFVDSFPHVTTEDQESAIEDIIEDFSLGRPMDRLLCADVGFGKTEVALRAACIAVLGTEPVQVAVIVPTTLLARQHFATFAARFKDFAVTINQLSKFTPRNQIAQIKEQLRNGALDIVIGTHALLANDISFKKLGLIIIDEEQHFGVAQKEKLKKMKANVHMLTLSATPIPRTLQMALADIKSLSLITTAPANRQPVQTVVAPYDSVMIREALLREKNRQGLSFYVTPRISYLDEIEQQLKQIAPELKVAKANGSLASSRLDQIMNDFYDHKFDVLLSTSIIESGLDIMNANTIIVDRANMFGLSQLYQMRGRVGRGPRTAIAYFLTPRLNLLHPTAKKRLEILQSLQALGSGFSIASHDMDSRGYGNLFGDEQSGHIKEIGVELYQRMLADMVADLRNQEHAAPVEWSPSLNFGLSVQIPESYIDDSALRLSLYRKIAEIESAEAADAFAIDMENRFGALPEEVRHLFDIIKLKQLSKALNIERIDAGAKGLVLSFKDNKVCDMEKLVLFIAAEREFEAKFRPDGKLLLLLRPHAQSYNQIGSAKRILMQLAK